VLYAALVTLSHTYRSNTQPCNLSAAIVPSEWCSALVHPILKPNIPDPRNPANYRGIALQSVLFKVLCNILNARLSDWSETIYILSDEQSCFRPDHSCLDHLFCHLQCYWSQKIKLDTVGGPTGPSTQIRQTTNSKKKNNTIHTNSHSLNQSSTVTHVCCLCRP